MKFLAGDRLGRCFLCLYYRAIRDPKAIATLHDLDFPGLADYCYP
ncbi:hypothetical protein [Planktothricoides raciborskii]|nr:hypothetical protein [Planktothricoides raciborskii]